MFESKVIIKKFHNRYELSPYEKCKWDKETRTKSGTAPNLDDSFCVFEKVMLPKIGLRTVKKDKLELYDKEKKTLYLPIGVGDDYIEEKLYEANVQWELHDFTSQIIRPREIAFNLDPKYQIKDKYQAEGIEFLTTKNLFHSKILALATGIGKTFCAISAAYRLKVPMLIISETLGDQWCEKIIEYTNKDCTIENHMIKMIKGTDNLHKLAQRDYSKNVEAFYITTSSSLARYIDVYGMDGLNKLCDELSIGIVCFDEFHMHWVQNVKINMAINCENTWYLTATPTRTDNGESRVFRRTMNKIPIYGEKTQTIRNDINLRLIDYNTYPTDYDIQSCMTYKGLSAINYWNYIFNNEKRRLYLLGMIKMVIDECLEKEPDGKILIYLAKNEHIKTFKEMLENLYKDDDNISFGNYTGLVKKNKKRYEIRNNIIFTTIGSGGVGLDVSDLVATLSFVPYSSIIISNQMIGRLRESKTKELYHYDFIDTGFKTMHSQRVKRIHVFRQKTKSEEEIKISYQDVINYIRK